MERIYIYYTFVLKEYILQLMGPYYPKEIIGLIIMSIYRRTYISCGSFTTVIIKNDIHVLDSTDNDIFRKISSCKDIKSVVFGWEYIVATSYVPNKLYVMGKNEYGQLGLGDYKDQYSPQKLILCGEIEAVSCGDYHTIALLRSGQCYVWGHNSYGQLGLGHCVDKTSPQELKLKDILQVACGQRYTIALTKFNRCYVWGYNKFGQLGLGNCSGNIKTPQELYLGKNIISVSCGSDHTVALTTNGNVYSWGRLLVIKNLIILYNFMYVIIYKIIYIFANHLF